MIGQKVNFFKKISKIFYKKKNKKNKKKKKIKIKK